MKIIGLSGDARAGKDTVGGMIVEWCESRGFTAQKDSFAAKLKISACSALGFLEPSVEEALAYCDSLKAEGSIITIARADGRVYDISGREFLQFYGTEAHREVFSRDFWVEALFKEYDLDEVGMNPEVLVVTDARFPNEATAIVGRGGEVINVVRPDNPDAITDGLESHASESGLPADLITRTLMNDLDLAVLQHRVDSYCAEVLG